MKMPVGICQNIKNAWNFRKCRHVPTFTYLLPPFCPDMNVIWHCLSFLLGHDPDRGHEIGVRRDRAPATGTGTRTAGRRRRTRKGFANRRRTTKRLGNLLLIYWWVEQAFFIAWFIYWSFRHASSKSSASIKDLKPWQIVYLFYMGTLNNSHN